MKFIRFYNPNYISENTKQTKIRNEQGTITGFLFKEKILNQAFIEISAINGFEVKISVKTDMHLIEPKIIGLNFDFFVYTNKKTFKFKIEDIILYKAVKGEIVKCEYIKDKEIGTFEAWLIKREFLFIIEEEIYANSTNINLNELAEEAIKRYAKITLQERKDYDIN